MVQNMRKKNRVSIEYLFTEWSANAIRGILSVTFLLYSVCYFLGSEYPDWMLSGQEIFQILALLLVVVIVYDFTLMCRKYRVALCGLIEIICMAGTGFFLYKKHEELFLGMETLGSDYIRYWNNNFGTNYQGPDGGGNLSFALAFIVFTVFLFCLIFRYITGARWFMVVPPIASLACGLLVNRLPDWRPIVFFFTGTLILYTGPEKSIKVDFYRKDRIKENIKQKTTNYLVPVVTLVFGLLIAAFTPAAFGGAAERIPERSSDFLAFQKSVEENIKHFSEMRLGFSNSWARVDNRTPEYTGEKVISIYASEYPKDAIYLKDFHSGIYQNGKWQTGERVFQESAETAGFEADTVNRLLNQRVYENNPVMDNNDGIQYRIDYENPFTKYALVPYNSEVPENAEDIWIEDEGIFYKKRDLKSLEVTGPKWQYQWKDRDYSEDENHSESPELVWYSEYVQEHYTDGKVDIPAVNDYAEKISSQSVEEPGVTVIVLGDDVYSSFYSDEDTIENARRMECAEQVRQELARQAEYNLYLDKIPEHTDTIQYFLETGHEGYCMHFASAGTLILQKLGIPARYASGYIVEKSAFKKSGEGYEAEVKDRNSHAWVEIYLEKTGWIPFEMTPAYLTDNGSGLPTDEDKQEELLKKHGEKQKKQETVPNSEAESQKEETQAEQNTETEVVEPEEVSEQETTYNDNNKNQILSDAQNRTNLYVVCIALITLAALSILIMVRLGILQQWKLLEHDLRNGKNRSAVKRMNRKIYKRMWKLHSLTDEEFMERLVHNYPAVPESDWRKYMSIVQRAVFSREEITQEEAKFCYKCYRKRKK